MGEDTRTKSPATKKRRSPMLVSLSPFEVELMKFDIGKRLLGEERSKRYLTYLRHLAEKPTTPPEGEGRNDHNSI